MFGSTKVLWGEGLFLRPQHFQRQDAYHEWRLLQGLQCLHPYAWGVRRLAIDADGLRSGVLRFAELALLFADGEFFAAPGEDRLPADLRLAGIAPGATALRVEATLAALRPDASNVAGAAGAGDDWVRYEQHDVSSSDLCTQAAPAEVALLRRRLRVVVTDADSPPGTGLPLARLLRRGPDVYDVDPQFVAPSLSIEAAPVLQGLLRRLLDVLQAKVDALYGLHREPSRHVIEFRSGDTASFWLLHTASSAHAALAHLQAHAGLHPERLYARLVELAGALLTFSKAHRLADLPRYDHADPGPSFQRLDGIVRELLETVISTRCFSIALNETRTGFHLGRLETDRITPATNLYLAVGAAASATEIVDTVPVKFKVGAPDDVDKLVLSAMGGVRLAHCAQVPAAIPVRPGAYYFALEPRGPLYDRMLQAQSVVVYAPAGVAELQLELFALNP